MSKEQAKGFPPCEPLSTNDASVNWAVFGTVIEVKNCPGRGHSYQERFKLANGWGVYQQANADYVYFHEISERSFREALGNNNIFSDNATTIKIHNPYFKNRHVAVMFAQKKASRRNYFFFQMNASPGHGGASETGWGKLFFGLFYDDGNMSSEEYRQFFIERLRIFDTPAAESFIAANQVKKIEPEIAKANISTPNSPSVICRGAIAPGNPLSWDEGTFSKSYVMEAKAKGLSLENCAKIAGRKDNQPAKNGKRDTYSLSLQWEGIPDLLAGTIHYPKKRDGTFIARLSGEGFNCAGSYTYGDDRKTGVWNIACANQKIASGTFKMNDTGSSGTGADPQGRKVKYTVSRR